MTPDSSAPASFIPRTLMDLSRRCAQVALSLMLLSPCALSAQKLPTTAKAEQLLATRPDLVAQLQAKILSSGLTVDQIHARLKALGYPENMLDEYLPGGPGKASPTDSALLASKALGFGDITVQLPQAGSAADTTKGAAADTTKGAAPKHEAAPAGKEELPIFGASLFSRGTSQFDATAGGPVDAKYRVGAGDVLILILTGDIETSYQLEVTREGYVVIPQVGQVFVANQTLGQITDLLYTRLSRVYSGIKRTPNATTKFSISMAKVRTNQIYVIGEVNSPGSYQVSSLGTMLTALYAAGGPTSSGSMRTIQLRRGGTAIGTLDLYDYLLRGDASHDLRLETGDVLFVPTTDRFVTIRGPVVRSLTYELKPSETLRDLLQYAGGLRVTASSHRALIERILSPADRRAQGIDRVALEVILDSTGVVPSYPLLAGDGVTVFSVDEKIHNRITVEGDVFVEGPQGFRPGMRLSDAIRAAGGVRPDVYTDQVLISRLLSSDSTRQELRTSLRDSLGTPVDNMVLHEDDVIHFLSRFEFRNVPPVIISGPVRNPGLLDFRVGLTLRDLVLRAGGFLDSTDVQAEALVSRLLANHARVMMRVSVFDAPRHVSDFALSPGDSVALSSISQYRPARYVAVTGAVRTPGQYAFHDGMTMRDLVQLAGGLLESAYLNEAEIARLPNPRPPGGLANTMRVPLDSTYLFERTPDGRYRGPPGIPAPTSRAPDVTLEPYDNVLINRQPEWQLLSTVAVLGNVKFPGSYVLTRRDERLSEIIQRAGGLTPYAYPQGMRFYRSMDNVGRIDIDLPLVLKDPRTRDNLILEPGDTISVPDYIPTVRVTGGVNAAGSVSYRPGADMNYYIGAAGGLAVNGDKGRAYVTQPSGLVQPYHERWWILPDNVPTPNAGAAIVVPTREPKDVDYIGIAGAIAQILASSVAIFVAIKK
jgi:polysaccharide biosynthesis/export protein